MQPVSYHLPSLYYLETIIHFRQKNVYKQKWTKYAQNDTLKLYERSSHRKTAGFEVAFTL